MNSLKLTVFFSPFVDLHVQNLVAILVVFDIQKQAVMDIISDQHEPSGLLPFQMPADMLTIEQQAEDSPRDMRCYKDVDGHTYDFAYGMNWKGVIRDWRVEKYY